MCKYSQHKSRQEAERDTMPMFFAYSIERLNEQMETRGIKTFDEITSLGSGGYIKKGELNNLVEMVNRHVAEDEEAKKDPEFVYDMFRYELGNHEFCITHELDDTLAACSVTEEELEGNEMFRIQLGKAVQDYLADCEY